MVFNRQMASHSATDGYGRRADPYENDTIEPLDDLSAAWSIRRVQTATVLVHTPTVSNGTSTSSTSSGSAPFSSSPFTAARSAAATQSTNDFPSTPSASSTAPPTPRPPPPPPARPAAGSAPQPVSGRNSDLAPGGGAVASTAPVWPTPPGASSPPPAPPANKPSASPSSASAPSPSSLFEAATAAAAAAAPGTASSSPKSSAKKNNFAPPPPPPPSHPSVGRPGSFGASAQPRGGVGQETLPAFQKNFYQEHPEVAKLSEADRAAVLAELGAEVEIPGENPSESANIPKPVRRFDHAGFPKEILEEMQFSGFSSPTAVQSVCWPIALSGHDMIGLAQTGSGKTLAYLLPAWVHMAAQPPLRQGDGPIALILAPTRELALQIQMEAFKLSEVTNLRDAICYGGVPKNGQIQALRAGAEVVIATPGRLLDLLAAGATNLNRVTYLVVDEADRMLDMGFEPQLRAIISQIRPDRQTLLWSATWPRSIQHLAREICSQEPIKVSIGTTERQANPDILQDIRVVRELGKRGAFMEWLREVSPPGEEQPRVLIFVETKRAADALARELKSEQFEACAMHGDKDQRERDIILNRFRTGEVPILIATDVAQRGLDVKDVRYVVNFDVPKTIEDYIHRIGRTGRAGAQGKAVTFFGYDFPTSDRVRLAHGICEVMQEVGQQPPAALLKIAAKKRGSSGQ